MPCSTFSENLTRLDSRVEGAPPVMPVGSDIRGSSYLAWAVVTAALDFGLLAAVRASINL
jgi:hypothetical protein